ncbi:MAG: magnesium/cobalt transporter CorA [Methanosarcinales archaeon]|jgi:magnesium transporter|nr:magnesium/cobalt transporter CorA [Methanosarcinales archaeon]
MPEETITNQDEKVSLINQCLLQETPVAKESDKAGLPPGTLVYIDRDGKDEEKLREKSTIRMIQYNEAGYCEMRIENPDELTELDLHGKITWIQISGLWDVESVRRIGEIFHLNPLILEVILDMEQRSKMQEHDNYLLTILKQIHFDEKIKAIKDNQISIFTFEKVVLVFCEDNPRIFKPIIDRIKEGRRIRRLGTDYLTYALIDMVVDHYFYVVESFEEWMSDIEKRIITNPEKEAVAEITTLRQQLSVFKKVVWPTMAIAEEMENCDSRLIKKQMRPLFHHVFEHAIRIMESIETNHEIMSGIYDLYTSGVSNKLNDTMRVLTIIATIFIPLTFIAGVYGMNFGNMPELDWEYGYFITLGGMTLISLTMLLFFRKKKWI